MILQDLIRNVLFYNGVIDPYLQSMREYVFSLINPSKKQNFDIPSEFRGYSLGREGTHSHEAITGTQTFPSKHTQALQAFLESKTNITSKEDQYSSFHVTMLTSKSLVNSGKTHSHVANVCLDSYHNKVGTCTGITTGLLNEKPNLFFSRETHEKREYLGEFSLLHEENHLSTFLERR